ncbi:MAG: galactose mutarotase-like enzyme [Flammeovirgaceae bacterium]|jgi:galactose mutarotase-like enzyme
MNYTIENEFLTAEIKTYGAELCSLKSKQTNLELIWQAEKLVWGRHAPILFPIVGKLKNDSYQHEGKTYQLSQHGFARDCEFAIELVRKDEIVFLLTENEETLTKYPFRFQLYVSYKLVGNELVISYKVVNSDSERMYFSIGAHPAFRCPIESGKKREDYSLEFNEKETAHTYLLEGGNFNGEKELILDNSNSLPLTKTTFDKDALVFKNLKSEEVSLLENGERKITFKFPNFPYLGIWSKNQDSEFVCIEPWFGLADSVDATGELAEKEGILTLEANNEFICAYSVLVE